MSVAIPTRTFSFEVAQERWATSTLLTYEILVWLVASGFVVEIGDEFAVTDLGREWGQLLDDTYRDYLGVA